MTRLTAVSLAEAIVKEANGTKEDLIELMEDTFLKISKGERVEY